MARILIISAVLVCVVSVVRCMERDNTSNQLVCYTGVHENRDMRECDDDAPVRNNMRGWMPTASSLVRGGKLCVQNGAKVVTYGAYAVLPALVSAGTNSTNSTEADCVFTSGPCQVITLVIGATIVGSAMIGCGTWCYRHKNKNEYILVKQETKALMTQPVVTEHEEHSQPIACVSANKKHPSADAKAVNRFKDAVEIHCNKNFERNLDDCKFERNFDQGAGNDNSNSDS
jgi:hypothetical protein